MRLDRYPRAADFLTAAGPWLTEREAEHNLLLGIAGAIDQGTLQPEEPPYFAVVGDGRRIVAAALRTGWNLVLSEVDDPAALELVVDDLAADDIPGVTGPPDAVDRLAALWTARRGGSVRRLLEERIYRLVRVTPPKAAPGRRREAALADRDHIVEWFVAFHDEALPAEGGDAARRRVVDWTPEVRRYWFWEDGGVPVCMVGAGNPTPNGIRIGPVYTPPQHRGRGYASNLTAAVSQQLLDEGRRFCFLYTDLANPTSNRIYQAIGYRPVADALVLAFDT
jgi:hypothetical protein